MQMCSSESTVIDRKPHEVDSTQDGHVPDTASGRHPELERKHQEDSGRPRDRDQ